MPGPGTDTAVLASRLTRGRRRSAGAGPTPRSSERRLLDTGSGLAGVAWMMHRAGCPVGTPSDRCPDGTTRGRWPCSSPRRRRRRPWSASSPDSRTSCSALPKLPQKLSSCLTCGRGKPVATASAKPCVIGSVMVFAVFAGMCPALSTKTCSLLDVGHRQGEVDGEVDVGGGGVDVPAVDAGQRLRGAGRAGRHRRRRRGSATSAL